MMLCVKTLCVKMLCVKMLCVKMLCVKMLCVKMLCVNELRLTGRALGLLEEIAIIASKEDVYLICLAE